MAKNLLQIIQAAQGELGLPQSSSIIGSTDATTIQMLALAQRAIDEIRRWDHRWTACQFEYDLVVIPPIKTTGDLGINSAVITNILPNTTGITANFWTVGGNSIPIASRVQSVDSPSQITMTMEASLTAAITAAPLTFSRDTYPIPTDFDFFNNRTMWDRTNRWELLGPDSPQLDQWHRSGIVVTGPRRHFRQIGPGATVFRLWPPPTEIVNPLQLVFEYLSLNSVQDNTTSPVSYKQYFTKDGDTPLLDDQSIIMGIKWMFWEAKGFNYADMKNRWQDYVDRQTARDGAAPTLTLVKRVNPIFVSPSNVQDGFFPGPVGPNTP